MKTRSVTQNLPDPDDMFADTRMSMGDHIEELRRHLLRAIYGFALGLLFSLFIGQWVMKNWIAAPVEEQLMFYWQRFNQRQLGKIVEESVKSGQVKLPRYPIDMYKLAAHFEVRGKNGEKIGSVVPKGAPLIDLRPGVEELLRRQGLDFLIDKEKLTESRWFYLEPDVYDYVQSMQELNLAMKPPTLATMAPQEAFVVYPQGVHAHRFDYFQPLGVSTRSGRSLPPGFIRTRNGSSTSTCLTASSCF